MDVYIDTFSFYCDGIFPGNEMIMLILLWIV